MEQSLFKQWVDKWFGPIARSIVKKVNGKEKKPKYLFKTMLTKKFSPTLKWGSLTSNGTVVSADVVAMNTSLPLKKRDSIEKADGDIPKVGMKFFLDEKTMTELDILESTNQNNSNEKEIIKNLFSDTKKCIGGVYERIESMWLSAISTGYLLIQDEKNVGIGIRANFNHPDDNKIGVGVKWSDVNAKPIEDIENVLDRADDKGADPNYMLMDKASWRNFRTKSDVKQLFAASLGIPSSSDIPTPTLKQANAFLDDNYSLQIIIIDRKITTEKNGVHKRHKPFAENTVVFLESLKAGELQYGRLAEEKHKVEGVAYQKLDDYILLSKYHKNDPLREFTSSQALVIPVPNNMGKVFILSTEEAETDAQTEGDNSFTYKGTNYTKASVIAAINKAYDMTKAKANNTDATLLKYINEMSDEEVGIFEANITAV